MGRGDALAAAAAQEGAVTFVTGDRFDMQPISFSCRATLPFTSAEIATQILRIDLWPSFTGYGPLPGIRSAEFEARTPDVIGTRIRVVNTDGSTHVEEVVDWEPERRLRLDLKEFSPPVSRLADRFEEVWEFTPTSGGTDVVRTMRLYARSRFSRPILWLISLLLRRALARHLRQMHAGATAAGDVAA